jgi:hypothetical protein
MGIELELERTKAGAASHQQTLGTGYLPGTILGTKVEETEGSLPSRVGVGGQQYTGHS